jgi:hypothetical protein
LPISFFKDHAVKSTEFKPQLVFESSGTTQTTTSRHYVKDAGIYEESFIKGFELFYGDTKAYCILGLLPSYLGRSNSSLVYMVDKLMQLSGHSFNGFYLHNYEELFNTLRELESNKQPVILFGVTYALLDFAEAFTMKFEHTTIIETGGMKGRKREMTRQEVHALLKKQFGVKHIHSEYGMTELLSQAYSKGDGVFSCPPWMKILVRDEDDPFEIKQDGRGIINVVDLANIYSCSFIATDDAGVLHDDGGFEVLGRVDNSDIRGCSLLAL